MKLKEIAELAGVSPSAVSLVLKQKSGVGREKREEIMKLLVENGYTVDPSTIATNKPQYKTIRFLKLKSHAKLVDGNFGFISAIMDAVEKECRKKDYTLLIATCDVNKISEIKDLILSNPTDGLLILGTELNNSTAIDLLSDINIPAVIIDNPMPMLQYNCITMNNEEAIYSSVNHLINLGHTSIGFLANNMPANNCLLRFKSFYNACAEHGLQVDDSNIYYVAPTPEGAYTSIKEMLINGRTFPSALVANNDSIALGTMKALKEFGYRFPEDISIIGFDSIPYSSISDPPLTTIKVPCSDIGIWAVRLLLDRIKFPSSSVTKMLISTELIVRNSTAPYHNNAKK